LDINGHSFVFYSSISPTDVVVHNHLAFAPGTTNPEECKQYLKAFLPSLFAPVSLQAEELFYSTKKIAYKTMATALHDFFANPVKRRGFYKYVVENARKHDNTDV
jgi:hypothetical protein